MEYVTFGRTGLRVSVAGLGCGGFSRLGLGRGKSEAEAVTLIHQALGLGVNLFDTAAAYDTEAVLGKALASVPRQEVVIATKAPFDVSNPNSSAASAGASSVIDAAYRFVRHEPGVDVVLFGTSDPEHLCTNIASLLAPPLPEADRARLASLFGHLVGVGLDAPHLARRARA